MKTKDKEITSFRKSPPELVVLDLGNSDLKGMLAGKPETETILQHQIVFPNSAHFKRMTKRAENHRVEFEGAEMFTKIYRDKSERDVMIGEGITDNARSNKLTGETKYKEKYFDILLGAMLKRLLPNGHNNIWLALATPSDAIDHLEKIKSIVGGLHKVRTIEGDTIKFNVKRLIFWEEPSGGLMRFLERNEKAHNAIEIQEGQRIIVVDIGGKISSMTVVGIGRNLEPTVLYNESPEPFNLGIIDVLETFAQELKGLHSEKFIVYKTAGSIPRNMLEDGIRTGKIMLFGSPFEVKQARMNSLSKIADEIETRYENDMQRGANASHIIVTGGGGGLLIPMLRNDVLQHASIHLADDIKTINKANLRGGSIALIEWLEMRGFLESV